MTIEKLPLVFIVAFGRSGNYYLHSLLDSHKQILIPPPFSFYWSWNILGGDQAVDPDDMFSRWQNYFSNAKIMSGEKNERRFDFTENQNDIFLRRFKSLLIDRGISRKRVFWSIHEAYSEAQGIDSSQIKVLVHHEHLPFSLDKIIADFPEARFLIIIRDLRAAVSSAFRLYKNHFGGDVPDIFFNLTFDQWWEGQQFWKKHYGRMGEDFKVIKNEDLNNNVDAEMRELAAWLRVEFSQSLMESTFCGKPWLIKTSYLPRDHRPEAVEYDVPSDSKDFNLPANQETRWERELSIGQIAMIESFYRDFMVKFNYPCRTPDNLFWKFYGLINFLLPRKDQCLRWRKTYPKVREFKQVEGHLHKPIFKRTWNILPPSLKILSYLFFSIGVRFLVCFFPGDRGRRYP